MKLIFAYFSNRSMTVTYNGVTSSSKSLPGSTGAGTKLGMILFIVMVNYAGFPLAEINTNIGRILTEKSSRRNPIAKFHAKYLDDLTLASIVDMRKLVSIPEEDVVRPQNFHERTG